MTQKEEMINELYNIRECIRRVAEYIRGDSLLDRKAASEITEDALVSTTEMILKIKHGIWLVEE